jgi:hypothetical protein
VARRRLNRWFSRLTAFAAAKASAVTMEGTGIRIHSSRERGLCRVARREPGGAGTCSVRL